MNFSSWFSSRHPQIPIASADAVLRLADGGATVPFLARYRKEETGNLDEVAIRQVLEAKESWDEIVKRQAFIVEEIERQQKLTPELKAQILGTFDLALLEDLYLPYKQKRKTKAAIAREAGLEPLAQWLWDCGHGVVQPEAGQTPQTFAASFVAADKGVADADAALAGAGEIVIERLSEDAVLRQTARTALFEQGCIRTRKSDKAKPASRFENYFAFQEPVAELMKPQSSHRYLAMRRGWMEEELVLSVGGALPPDDEATDTAAAKPKGSTAAPVDPLLERLATIFQNAACSQPRFAGAPLLHRAARMSLRAHVVPAIENEVHKALREVADQAAITVFAENVRKLLLSAPFGPKAVLGVDPGIRTGCKLAVIDGAGKYVGSGLLHLETPAGKASAAPVLAELVSKGGIQAIAVGNGTAGRETEMFVREALKFAGLDVPVVMVSESGASVYSASEVAREEFPDLDVTIRGAISIARRLQDPLAELVKIDPKSIGVGQYQHDVSPHALKKSLDAVIDSCVNQVGVNLNTASYHLLSHVSGIGPSLARAIVEHRGKTGIFRSRAQLLDVPRFSKRVFEQAAGFLRIPEAEHPLDNTGVHPERYGVLEKLAARLGVPVAALLGAGVKQVKEARELKDDVGAFTFDDMVKELEKPGRDPRAGFVPFAFRQDIHELKDLQPGMACPGIVTNVTNFGAFVDIGVHQDGLVHISQLSDKFVKDPREVVSPGDRVTVRVLEVKLDRKQIALTMKAERAAASAASGERREAAAPRTTVSGGPRASDAGAGRGGFQPRAPAPAAAPPLAAKSPFNNPFAALQKLRKP
ncbi:MAG TPA: Tex family protein [Polyangia bacterium]|nr:Tex family protein [Polyangia bacterium]